LPTEEGMGGGSDKGCLEYSLLRREHGC